MDHTPTTSGSRASVARRLAWLSLVGLAAVLLAVAVAIGVIEQRSTRAQLVSTVTERVQSVVAVADAYDRINRELVQRAFRSFRNSFGPTLSLDPATGQLSNADKVVNDDFSAVDQFSQDTGGVATVFAKKGDDFLRITTSLKKQDGARAMGTLLDRSHPAYALVQSGQSYTGPAVLFGTPYMTRYEPIKDAAGAIVGIFFVGSDIKLQQAALEKQVTESKFFATGGIYLLDARGPLNDAKFSIHPTAKGKKVLEAFPQAEPFLTVLSTAPDGYVSNAATLLGSTPTDT